jgi:hypothetical protein
MVRYPLPQVLQTKVFSPGTAATTTVSDSGEPRGSTKLDAITWHNCVVTMDDYTTFTIVVLANARLSIVNHFNYVIMSD